MKTPAWLKPLLAVLAIVAGLNWILLALADIDIVAALVGGWPWLAMIAYVLAGGSAAWLGLKSFTK